MKDNFSKQSRQYAQFRPSYPDKLFEFLLTHVPARTSAWDCGTGNGQVAIQLSKYFLSVYATDISTNQIQHAVQKKNIIYKIEQAEQSSFPDNAFDLIVVAQAIHWFDFDKFYHEVNRTLKPNGIIAVIGYTLPHIDGCLDEIINRFYHNIVGDYWDRERTYVDQLYRTIPFPYKEMETPKFQSTYDWSFEHLLGYLNTWSAVQHYIDRHNENPVDNIMNDIQSCWGETLTKNVTFPILIRVGKRNNNI